MFKVILLAMSLVGVSAFAGDMFKSPSGNILCYGDDDSVECRIVNKTNKTTLSKPKDCELDWGDGFGVSKTGRAYLTCYGDALSAFEMSVLAYGKTIKGKGWQCTSAKTGMTCKNSQGHGFTLRRNKQTLF